VEVKRRPPPPVDYFEVAPYSRGDLVFHVTGGALATIVTLTALVVLVATWGSRQPPILVLTAAVLAGVYLADLVSGLLHWAFDTWFDESMTFIRRMVIMVREHHVYPQRIFQFSVLHDAGTLSWIASILTVGPVAWAVFFAAPGSVWASAVATAVVVFNVLLIFMLEFHKCGHRREAATWVRWLQRSGLLLSSRHHMRHHSGNHDFNYCLINGWADLTLGRLGLFRGLERLIYRFTGAVPQRNDHEWLRRFGRPVGGRRSRPTA